MVTMVTGRRCHVPDLRYGAAMLIEGDIYSPRPIRAVLFDFFGTLTKAVMRGTEYEHVARTLGSDGQALGKVLDETFYARATGKFGAIPDAVRKLAARLGITITDAQVKAVCAARFAALRHDASLRDDAIDTLLSLRARGIRVGVVTDCTAELPAAWLDLEVSRYVQAVAFSSETGVCKPHPLMYRTACEALDVSPEECLYVGDGGSRELTGALSVGLRPLRLTAPDSAWHLSHNPERDWRGPTIESLSQVLAHCDDERLAAVG